MRVLVVDDEADARELVSAVLEHRGGDVVTASCVGEALELLAAFRPCVIVSDIGMPGEDGYSLLRRVRDIPAELGGNTPAVALTAFTRVEDQHCAFAAGFDRHLGKPVDADALVTAIADLASASR